MKKPNKKALQKALDLLGKWGLCCWNCGKPQHVTVTFSLKEPLPGAEAIKGRR